MKGQILLNVGKRIFDDGVVKHGHLTLNAKPQLVLCLVDGESIGADPEQQGPEWLETITRAAQQNTTTLNDSAQSVVIVLGGRQISTFDGLYFVDLDGEGPSLFDVINDAVRSFVERLDQFNTNLHASTLGLARTAGGEQISSNPSDTSKHLPNRVNGSAAMPSTTNPSTNEVGSN